MVARVAHGTVWLHDKPGSPTHSAPIELVLESCSDAGWEASILEVEAAPDRSLLAFFAAVPDGHCACGIIRSR